MTRGWTFGIAISPVVSSYASIVSLRTSAIPYPFMLPGPEPPGCDPNARGHPAGAVPTGLRGPDPVRDGTPRREQGGASPSDVGRLRSALPPFQLGPDGQIVRSTLLAAPVLGFADAPHSLAVDALARRL